MAEKQAPLLSKLKVPVATLNKKLIVGLIVILTVVLLAIIVSALNSSNSAPAKSPALTITPNNSAPPSTLSSLPSNYSDAQQINEILSHNQGGMSPQAQRQITLLQSAQQQLEQQLNQMRQQQDDGFGGGGPLSQEAASSSIFFAGGAPQPLNQEQLAANAAQVAKSKAEGGANGAGAGNSYASQNMQSQKVDFLTSLPNKKIYNENTVQYPATPYILQAGSVIPAILQSRISTNLPGVITALVSQDVYDSISGKYLIIPRGSKLIGEYNSSVSFGQEQVQVKFTRLIRPDGSSILLPNQPGTNKLGSSGLSDEVNNHWGKIIGSAALSALFSLPAIIATNQMNQNTGVSYNGSTYTNSPPSVGSTVGASALQSAGAAASQVGTQLASQSLNIQPEIIIHPGYQFSVMVTKDIVLPPYSETANGP